MSHVRLLSRARVARHSRARTPVTEHEGQVEWADFAVAVEGLDIYIEAPDGLGGFVRHHESPEIIRGAAPVYIKLGLRNAPDIYPAGKHLESMVINLCIERVRRSKMVFDLIRREYPEAVMSPLLTEDLGVPEP